MALFGRKKTDEERLEDAMRTAERIGQGRGLAGGLTRLMGGSEVTGKIKDAMEAARSGQAGMAAMQAGAPVRTASVSAVADTGQTINDNPVVELTLDLDGQTTTLRTIVSRLQIPRPGDHVNVLENPAGGAPLYGGLAA